MKVKLSGKQYKEFMKDNVFWPEGLWVEEDNLSVDDEPVREIDEDDLSDSAIITIEDGFLNCDDNASDKAKAWQFKSYQPFIKKWLQQQTNQTLVIDVPKEQYDEVLTYLKTHKCKIILK
jgi:hypothetical protein